MKKKNKKLLIGILFGIVVVLATLSYIFVFSKNKVGETCKVSEECRYGLLCVWRSNCDNPQGICENFAVCEKHIRIGVYMDPITGISTEYLLSKTPQGTSVTVIEKDTNQGKYCIKDSDCAENYICSKPGASDVSDISIPGTCTKFIRS